MEYIVEEQKCVSLPIVNDERLYPVGRVYCVGRNYAEHAREMGDDPERDPPFFFCKDASCVVPASLETITSIPYPMATERYEYEVELVIALGSGGQNLSIEEARCAILGYAIGLDMTRRDRQSEAKQKGRPWEVGKSFSFSAPISPLFLKSEGMEVSNNEIGLKVNGKTKQLSRTNCLTWSVEEVICKLSEVFDLQAGDLIMTGTPENVGTVVPGDNITAWIENLGEIRLCITD